MGPSGRSSGHRVHVFEGNQGTPGPSSSLFTSQPSYVASAQASKQQGQSITDENLQMSPKEPFNKSVTVTES